MIDSSFFFLTLCTKTTGLRDIIIEFEGIKLKSKPLILDLIFGVTIFGFENEIPVNSKSHTPTPTMHTHNIYYTHITYIDNTPFIHHIMHTHIACKYSYNTHIAHKLHTA